MRKFVIVALPMAILVSAIAVAFSASQEEEWLPYIPSPNQVELRYWRVGDIAYINVTVTLGTPCYKFEWGQVQSNNSVFWADAKIWQYTGPCIQVVTKFTNIYKLGTLKPGQYKFIFMVWGRQIKSITFWHLPPITIPTTS